MSSFDVFFHVICLAINGLSGILDTICEESARVSRLLEASLPATTELQVVGVYRQICGATMGKCCSFFLGTVCVMFAVLYMMCAVFKVYEDGNEIANHLAKEEEEIEPFSLVLIRGSVLENFHVENFASGKIVEIEYADVRNFCQTAVLVQVLNANLSLGVDLTLAW